MFQCYQTLWGENRESRSAIFTADPGQVLCAVEGTGLVLLGGHSRLLLQERAPSAFSAVNTNRILERRGPRKEWAAPPAQKSEKTCLIVPQGTEGKALKWEATGLPAERRTSLRHTPGKAACTDTPTSKTNHCGPWLIINPETAKSSLQSWRVLGAHPNTSSNCQLRSTKLREFISINNTLSCALGKQRSAVIFSLGQGRQGRMGDPRGWGLSVGNTKAEL